MKLGKIYISLILLVISLAGCEKEEPLYTAPEVPIGTQSTSFFMGENYENQLWFEFSTQKQLPIPLDCGILGFP